ncbi:MAG: biopolymer transporter ExbD [Rubrivivax sp.]|nr:biopolymer transporter ExbD [Rubrivivax sp.]
MSGKPSSLDKRAERRSRNQQHVDMNLVALIDIFTILIFFLLSSAAGVELLNSPKTVKLPESTAEKAPRETVVVVVAGDDILVDGRRVATVSAALAEAGDEIAGLKTELQGVASRRVVNAAANADVRAASRAVTLMADKDIPYRLLRKLMVTCSQAEFADVSFAVRQQLKVS